MIFARPISFADAVQTHAVRSLLGTELSGAEMSAVLRELPADFRNRGFFSARVADYNLLKRLCTAVQNSIDRQAGLPADRNFIRDFLAATGYTAAEPGAITDLSSFGST